jgi:hypothetical protein
MEFNGMQRPSFSIRQRSAMVFLPEHFYRFLTSAGTSAFELTQGRNNPEGAENAQAQNNVATKSGWLRWQQPG